MVSSLKSERKKKGKYWCIVFSQTGVVSYPNSAILSWNNFEIFHYFHTFFFFTSMVSKFLWEILVFPWTSSRSSATTGFSPKSQLNVGLLILGIKPKSDPLVAHSARFLTRNKKGISSVYKSRCLPRKSGSILEVQHDFSQLGVQSKCEHIANLAVQRQLAITLLITYVENKDK